MENQQKLYNQLMHRQEFSTKSMKESNEISHKFQKFEDFLNEKKKNFSKIYLFIMQAGAQEVILGIAKREKTVEEEYKNISQASALATLVDMAKLHAQTSIKKEDGGHVKPSHISIQETPIIKPASTLPAKMERQQSKRQMDEKFNISLFPYTIHCELLVLPTAFAIRVDTIKKSESLFELAIKAEQELKFQVIQQILKDTRDKFEKLTELFKEKKNAFIKDNRELIDLQRAKLMLRTPLQKLKDIHRKENVQNQMRRKRREKNNFNDYPLQDHLPFGDLKELIAEKLPNAPQKPQFKIILTIELFKKYFNNYCQSMKKKLQDLETRNKFGVQKR